MPGFPSERITLYVLTVIFGFLSYFIPGSCFQWLVFGLYSDQLQNGY
jgi:hypothetical protein